ncbi:MAG: hypothetical protein J0I98_06725 [Mesorhizobium sp.]|nr:hypothetical protein [Mesorhizobium sp.]MBN9242469.1 hypothetical protein [Mesorhizobium sp.]
MAAVSTILESGKTPEEWVEVFAARGIHLSARTIRADARRLGACKILGNAMILLPEHIDLLFQEPEKCHSNSTSETDGGGSRAASTEYRPVNTTDKALEYLRQRQKGTPKSRSPGSKGKKSNVISLGKRGP